MMDPPENRMMDRKKGQMENLTLVHKHDLTANDLLKNLQEKSMIQARVPFELNIK